MNEPLPGQGVMWSSVSANPYPVSFRALSFEKIYPHPLDSNYDKKSVKTFATELRAENRQATSTFDVDTGDLKKAGKISEEMGNNPVAETGDFYSDSVNYAIQQLQEHPEFKQKLINGNGLPWGVLIGFTKEFIPADLQDDIEIINTSIIKPTLIKALGEEGKFWKSEKRPKKGGGETTWVVRITE